MQRAADKYPGTKDNSAEKYSALKMPHFVPPNPQSHIPSHMAKSESRHIDILIVIDDCTEDEYIDWKNKFSNYLNIPVSWISLYRHSKILKMYESGSYFLWHIKKEGKIIYSRSNEMPSLLLTLPRYNNTENDLEEYSEILSDIKCELNDEYICVEYELAVLASLVRNTCIAISYLDERLDFGRNSAVMYCFSKYKININLKEYTLRINCF